MSEEGEGGGQPREGVEVPPEEEVVRRPAHAKVNLHLRVLGREPSGYHAVETLYLRMDLHDYVEVRRRGGGLELEIEGEPEVPSGSENLCWQAAERFFEAAGREPDVLVRLMKRVPAGAGLGGGSADAAATLRCLNQLHGEPLEERELVRIAGDLGSDVPFSLAECAMALGWERGRRLLPLKGPPTRPAIVVEPGFGIDTSEAYTWVEPEEDPGALVLPHVAKLADWDVLSELAFNVFHEPVTERHPELAEWQERLVEAGARPAMLAGSGSSLFGVFPESNLRDAAAVSLMETAEQEDGARVHRTRAAV